MKDSDAIDHEPELDDTLGGLNERYPFIDDSLGRPEALLFIRNLHNDLREKLRVLQSFSSKLTKDTNLLEEKLKLAPNTGPDNDRLMQALKISLHLQQLTFDLQNQFANTEKYVEWFWMQYVSLSLQLDKLAREELLNSELEAAERELIEKDRETNRLEQEAQRARHYPYRTSFYYSP